MGWTEPATKVQTVDADHHPRLNDETLLRTVQAGAGIHHRALEGNQPDGMSDHQQFLRRIKVFSRGDILEIADL